MTVTRPRIVAALGALLTLGGVGHTGHTGAPGSLSAQDALQTLLAGNARYVADTGEACRRSTAVRRHQLISGQTPRAIILSCADSRVPPELVFDQSLGELFVVRVAGNVPDPVVLGSLEYGAEHLGAPLLLVLGHTRCGAVSAAVKARGHTAEGNLGAILRQIAPAVELARGEAAGTAPSTVVDSAVAINVTLVAQALTTTSSVLRTLVTEEKLTIVGALYDLDTGTVTLLETIRPGRKAPR